MIYVSGPLGNGGRTGAKRMYANVRRAEGIMVDLMRLGWSVICPHLSYYCWLHAHGPIPWDRWMRQDYELVAKADAVFYMIPEVYGESRGAAMEVAWARDMGTPVYTDLSRIPAVAPQDIIPGLD